MGADGDIDLHAGGHVITHDLHDGTDGLAAPGGLLHDLRHDHLSVAGTPRRRVGNHDVVMQATVVRADESHAAVAPVAAHDPVRVPLQDLHERPLAAPLAIDLRNPRHGAIAVHERAHLPGREEEIVAALVGDEKAEAIPVGDYPAPHQVHLAHKTVVAAAVADDLSVPLHGAQALGQGHHVPGRIDAEGSRQRARGHGPALVLEGLEHVLPAGDGIGVATRLAGALGISAGALLSHR